MSMPIPYTLKALRGNPGKKPMRPEPMPRIDEACPEPPAFLPAYAIEEWHRVAPDLHVIGILRGVDLQVLAGYCQSFATWRTALEGIAAVAAEGPLTGGLLVKTVAGNPTKNPLVKVAADASLAMLKFANELGIGPLARTRLASAGWEPEEDLGEFRGLIA
jgi:P27 family predicted phage terminase small subunit